MVLKNNNRPKMKRAYISELVSAIENKSRIRISLRTYEGSYYYDVEVTRDNETERFPIFINEVTFGIVSKLISPETSIRKYCKKNLNRLKCADSIVEIKRMPRLELLMRKRPVSNQLIATV